MSGNRPTRPRYRHLKRVESLEKQILSLEQRIIELLKPGGGPA